MASAQNLATPTQQDNPTFDRVWFELGFPQPTLRSVERDANDEIDEHDDTDWQDFLGYHSEVLR